MPAIAENNDGLIGAVLGAAGEAPYVRVRTIEDRKLGPEQHAVAPGARRRSPRSSGFDVAADRASGAIVAWVQGGAEDRQIVAGYLDRPPGFFAGYTSQRCCQRPLRAAELAARRSTSGGRCATSSPSTAQPVGETTDTRAAAHGAARGGHAPLAGRRVRRARPEQAHAHAAALRIDARAPSLAVRYKRKRRVVTLSVRARDPGLPRAHRDGPALGRRVVGRPHEGRGRDRRRCAPRTATARGGSYPLQITATDRAGNERTSLRTVRIG